MRAFMRFFVSSAVTPRRRYFILVIVQIVTYAAMRIGYGSLDTQHTLFDSLWTVEHWWLVDTSLFAFILILLFLGCRRNDRELTNRNRDDCGGFS